MDVFPLNKDPPPDPNPQPNLNRRFLPPDPLADLHSIHHHLQVLQDFSLLLIWLKSLNSLRGVFLEDP